MFVHHGTGIHARIHPPIWVCPSFKDLVAFGYLWMSLSTHGPSIELVSYLIILLHPLECKLVHLWTL